MTDEEVRAEIKRHLAVVADHVYACARNGWNDEIPPVLEQAEENLVRLFKGQGSE